MSEVTIKRDRLAAWLGFLHAHSRIIEQLESDLAEAGQIPLSWYDVLVQLRHAPEGRLRLQELGGGLALSTSGLSRRVSRMEEAGLVAREPCPEDRRGVLVALTEAGERAYQSAAPIHRSGVNRYFADHLTDSEAATLRTAFDKMLAGLGRERPGGSGEH